MLKALRTSKKLPSSQLFASRFASPSLASGVRVHAARSYATEVAFPSTSSAHPVTSAGNPEGPLRPHLGVEVSPNHGLWAFFRKAVGKDGEQSYETIEKKNDAVHYSGTSLIYSIDVGACFFFMPCAELPLVRFVPFIQCRSCVECRRAPEKEF